MLVDGLYLEEKIEGELLEAVWQPKSEGTYPQPVIGQISEQEVKAAISASKPTSYVPPHARGNPEYANKVSIPAKVVVNRISLFTIIFFRAACLLMTNSR